MELCGLKIKFPSSPGSTSLRYDGIDSASEGDFSKNLGESTTLYVVYRHTAPTSRKQIIEAPMPACPTAHGIESIEVPNMVFHIAKLEQECHVSKLGVCSKIRWFARLHNLTYIVTKLL